MVARFPMGSRTLRRRHCSSTVVGADSLRSRRPRRAHVLSCLSCPSGIIESMFEVSLPDPAELDRCDVAALVAVIEDCARAENAASARRLSAIAELTRRRTASNEHADWACDEWDCAAAEVAAALGLSHRRASVQMHLSLVLK